jgi:2-polyprenyl-3-methyl-5-hydroxy-6-metoxy-1,4-benzoquinol methylase
MAHSDDYQAQLQRVHSQRTAHKAWGTTGGRNAGAELVGILRGRGDIKSVLDFGCGQRTLEKYVQASPDCHTVEWFNYDPGLPGLDELPTRNFDMIVSTDVLEHVEPELIDETIEWMQAHSKKFDIPGWGVMYTADCNVRKRSQMRRHCCIQVDKGNG